MNDKQAPRILNDQIEFINQRSEFLISYLSNTLEQVAKYLFVSNAGGAVATLSFLGAVEKFQSMPSCSLRISLISFAIGIVLVGCLRAQQYYRSEKLFDDWGSDVKSFLSGHLSWELMSQRDEERSKASRWGYVFAWGSFVCLISGIVSGGIALF